MNLKRIIAFFVVTMLIVALTACGAQGNTTGDSGTTQKQEEVPLQDFAGGSGTAEDPYLIAEAYQWKNIENDLSAHYALSADVSLVSLEGLKPIGTASKPFTGSLDGRGFKLKNVMVSAKEDCGLFGVISGATLKNITVEDSVIDFTYKKQDRIYYGGLAAQAKNASRIENCHITSTDIKYGTSWGDYIYVGGIVGNLTSFSEMVYCSVDMTFLAKDSNGNIHFGGLVGSAENASVLGCSAEGTVTVKMPSNSLNYKTRQVAGLIFKASNTTMMHCYSALDFIDNTAPKYTAALVYELDSEADICYNASFNAFLKEPMLADSTDNAKYNGRYNSCGLMRNDSESVNLYFRASEGISLEKMNSAVVGEEFGGAFKEGKLHPVLVDYETFMALIADENK